MQILAKIIMAKYFCIFTHFETNNLVDTTVSKHFYKKTKHKRRTKKFVFCRNTICFWLWIFFLYLFIWFAIGDHLLFVFFFLIFRKFIKTMDSRAKNGQTFSRHIFELAKFFSDYNWCEFSTLLKRSGKSAWKWRNTLQTKYVNLRVRMEIVFCRILRCCCDLLIIYD